MNNRLLNVIIMIVALLQAMHIKADSEVYINNLCYHCYDETMTAELVFNQLTENPVDIIVPETVEADGKIYTVTAIGNDPFMVTVRSVKLPPTIKRIGNMAFHSSKIEEIVLPDSIEIIGENAFGTYIDIPCLRKVVFPQKVKNLKIGDHAFSSCPIKELTLPEGLTELGKSSFSGVDIRTLTIPSTVKSIPYYCFCECRNLESVTLPEGIEYIGMCAFSDTKLQSFVIPSTIKEIDKSPFSASPLKDITIPASLTHWPDQFLYGTEIESISIPESVVEIGDECFRGCQNLKSITIPPTVKIVGEDIAMECNSLTTLTIPSSLEVLEGDQHIPETAQFIIAGNDNKVRLENGMLINDRGENGCWLLSIPDDAVVDGKFTVPEGITALGNNLLKEKPVEDLVNAGNIEYLGDYALSSTNINNIDMPRLKGLGEGAFSDCSYLTSITLPEGLKEIPTACFYNCHDLETVILPTTLEVIGYYAFYITGINHISLHEGLKEIKYGAFAHTFIEQVEVPSTCSIFHFNNSDVKTVKLPEGITTIPGSSFYACGALDNINLPSTIRSIEEKAFAGCTSLKEITLPEGLKTLGVGAFSLSGLTSIVIPESVTDISTYIFRDCPLTYCEIKSPLKEIPKGMFYRCSKLKQVVLPSTLERFNKDSFFGNTSLEEINFPSSFKEMGYSAMALCKLTHLTLPASVERLGDYSFAGIKSVSVDLSQTSITELTGYAFNECENIKQIKLPASLTSIHDNFNGSPRIERVECLSVIPPIVEGSTFDKIVFSQATLIVPNGTENAYRTADVWKNFSTINTPTGLTAPAFMDEDKSARIYDLRGMEVNAEKGIYIKGGKLRVKK